MGFVCLFGKEFISHLHIEPFRFHIATLCFAVLILSWGTYYLGGEKIQRRIKSARKSHSPKILGRFIKSLRLGAQKTEGIITAFIISLFFYLNMAILLWIACKSMGERVAFISTIKIIPFIVIVSAMPISIGGLGLKEGIRTLCLTAVGIPPGASFSIALLIRLIEWAHSGIGGFLYIIYANNSKPT
jgi:hypothetical protein